MHTSALRRCAALACLLAGGAALCAQEVSYMSPKWAVRSDAPEILPSLKRPLPVEFPASKRDTGGIGYVLIDHQLDDAGKIVHQKVHATDPEVAASVQRVLDKQKWAAGMRDEVAVNSVTIFGYIFNPPSAGTKAPDATPRLLETAYVVKKAAAAPAEINAKTWAPPPPVPDEIIEVELQVDEHGIVTEIRDAPDDLRRAVAIAVKNWKFAPARQHGQPVAAAVRVPMIVITEDPLVHGRVLGVQPKPRFQKPPVYPLGLRASGQRGEVLVGFIVDVEGRVRDARVIRSLNPSFDDPALEAVRQWRFFPGKVGDRFVNTRMQVPILFHIAGLENGGSGPVRSNGKKVDQSKLPEQFRFDKEAEVTAVFRPVYPYELLKQRKEGSAEVMYIIDEAGKISEIKVTEASAPEFGHALRAAVARFQFRPAEREGKPTRSLGRFQQKFELAEMWDLVRQDDFDLLAREKKRPERIVALNELDEALRPTTRKPFGFPAGSMPPDARATIEFLVDEEGRVRLPRVVETTDVSFAYDAVQSVAGWRFQPPERGGKPVMVRARLPITFKRAGT